MQTVLRLQWHVIALKIWITRVTCIAKQKQSWLAQTLIVGVATLTRHGIDQIRQLVELIAQIMMVNVVVVNDNLIHADVTNIDIRAFLFLLLQR